jgi:hypothetical protein
VHEPGYWRDRLADILGESWDDDSLPDSSPTVELAAHRWLRKVRAQPGSFTLYNIHGTKRGTIIFFNCRRLNIPAPYNNTINEIYIGVSVVGPYYGDIFFQHEFGSEHLRARENTFSQDIRRITEDFFQTVGLNIAVQDVTPAEPAPGQQSIHWKTDFIPTDIVDIWNYLLDGKKTYNVKP